MANSLSAKAMPSGEEDEVDIEIVENDAEIVIDSSAGSSNDAVASPAGVMLVNQWLPQVGRE